MGFIHRDRKSALKHAKGLRRDDFGIKKRKVYKSVSVSKAKGGYSVSAKESKGYKKWLRTGK